MNFYLFQHGNHKEVIFCLDNSLSKIQSLIKQINRKQDISEKLSCIPIDKSVHRQLLAEHRSGDKWFTKADLLISRLTETVIGVDNIVDELF
jgi:hypothetical protein